MSSKLRERLYRMQEGKCHWCGRGMTLNPYNITDRGNIKANNSYATFEHIIPVSLGGPKAQANQKLAHAGCNRNRQKILWEHDPIDWVKVKALAGTGPVYYWDVLKDVI